MLSKYIDKIIRESKKEGGVTALEEYDISGKFPWEKEKLTLTMSKSLLDEFRRNYNGRMSQTVEKLIEKELHKKY